MKEEREKSDKSVNEGKYGWRHVTPQCLQFLNRPKWALVIISSVSMNQGIVINGLLHLMVPHIERRFELSSTEASIVINAYDIGSLILLMPITYLGSRHGAHRPRIIGHGAILLGTGSLVFSLPAFITGPYNSEVITNLCQAKSPFVDKVSA
ncbi:hypothetical protein GE061_013481 [Apolygus lucorum]|uniref:Major facilitator superfamily (MFS) profile domain-containing protein n=1 Tax=Apolygus lucorum TaxID=248454 RepID=A0A8S9XN33_APOLU|nr:hypothetical protein GE061_013481 [Apolygus lucorum]